MRPDLRYLRRRRGRADRIAALEIELGLAEAPTLRLIRGYHPKPGEACTVVPDLGLVLPALAQLHALANARPTTAEAAAALHRGFDRPPRTPDRPRPKRDMPPPGRPDTFPGAASDYRILFDARSDYVGMLDVRGAPLKQPPRIGLYMAMLACPLSAGACLLPLLLAHLHV